MSPSMLTLPSRGWIDVVEVVQKDSKSWHGATSSHVCLERGLTTSVLYVKQMSSDGKAP